MEIRSSQSAIGLTVREGDDELQESGSWTWNDTGVEGVRTHTTVCVYITVGTAPLVLPTMERNKQCVYCASLLPFQRGAKSRVLSCECGRHACMVEAYIIWQPKLPEYGSSTTTRTTQAQK